VKQEDLLPSHELALSQMLKKDSFPSIDVGLKEALAFLRRDTMNLPEAPVGWNMLRYKGVSVGFVKKIGNRINNYYPTEWRIRMNLPSAGEENIIDWENGK
jgi:NOL1/NOP2/fmu family ribosome biogenesis protein